MEYFVNMLKKAAKSALIVNALILTLWGTLYALTDLETVVDYFWIGFVVCLLNSLIIYLRRTKTKIIFHVQSSWLIMAGVVLVLYHAGFAAAAVVVAAAILASPFFWASIYEGIVGLSLLLMLAKLML